MQRRLAARESMREPGKEKGAPKRPFFITQRCGIAASLAFRV
jgi:hypothetical protein